MARNAPSTARSASARISRHPKRAADARCHWRSCSRQPSCRSGIKWAKSPRAADNAARGVVSNVTSYRGNVGSTNCVIGVRVLNRTRHPRPRALSQADFSQLRARLGPGSVACVHTVFVGRNPSTTRQHQPQQASASRPPPAPLEHSRAPHPPFRGGAPLPG